MEAAILKIIKIANNSPIALQTVQVFIKSTISNWIINKNTKFKWIAKKLVLLFVQFAYKL